MAVETGEKSAIVMIDAISWKTDNYEVIKKEFILPDEIVEILSLKYGDFKSTQLLCFFSLEGNTEPTFKFVACKDDKYTLVVFPLMLEQMVHINSIMLHTGADVHQIYEAVSNALKNPLVDKFYGGKVEFIFNKEVGVFTVVLKKE